MSCVSTLAVTSATPTPQLKPIFRHDVFYKYISQFVIDINACVCLQDSRYVCILSQRVTL